MFENYKVYETELAGRPLKLETGMMAGLANAAVMAGYGDTRVLCTVTASKKPREGVDFFPLSVDYEEKMYSVGRIPGSFTRREGKASDKAVLASRCIDRPIRPLFPKDMRNDCSVVATVMSVDPDCSPEVAAAIGVSCAIAISDIPWAGPISSVSVGLVEGEIVINPTLEQRAKSDLNLTVSSTEDLVAMIEAGGNEIEDDLMFDCIMAGHEVNKQIVKFINGIVAEIGKPKFEFESNDPDPVIFKEMEDFCIEDVKKRSIPTISLFVMRLYSPFRMLCTKNMMLSLKVRSLRLMKFSILSKSTLFVLGLRTRKSVLTAEVLTKSVP